MEEGKLWLNYSTSSHGRMITYELVYQHRKQSCFCCCNMVHRSIPLLKHIDKNDKISLISYH